jgi:hypothetical protein
MPRGVGASASARRTIAIVAVLALVCVSALALSGCRESPRGDIVGTWVTGTGVTSGEMTFTASGVMTQAHNPPIKYVVVGDEVRSAAEGGALLGKIEWVSDDEIVYTTLTPGCGGLVLTYKRKK